MKRSVFKSPVIEGPGNADGPYGIQAVGVLHNLKLNAVYLILGKSSLERNMLNDGLDMFQPARINTLFFQKNDSHTASHFIIPAVEFCIRYVVKQGSQFDGQQVACPLFLLDEACCFPHPLNVIPVVASFRISQGLPYKINGLLNEMIQFEALYDPGKAHKSQGHEAGYDEGNGYSFHAFGDIQQIQLLANS